MGISKKVKREGSAHVEAMTLFFRLGGSQDACMGHAIHPWEDGCRIRFVQ